MKDSSPSIALIMKGDKLNLSQCSRNDFELALELQHELAQASVVRALFNTSILFLKYDHAQWPM
ncbi:hypothetical protein CR513_37286, partial [Mucuna pruriens]